MSPDNGSLPAEAGSVRENTQEANCEGIEVEDLEPSPRPTQITKDTAKNLALINPRSPTQDLHIIEEERQSQYDPSPMAVKKRKQNKEMNFTTVHEEATDNTSHGFDKIKLMATQRSGKSQNEEESSIPPIKLLSTKS